MPETTAILGLILQGRPDHVMHQMLHRQRAATVIPGIQTGRVSYRDRFGCRQGGSGQAVSTPAVQGLAVTEFVEHGDQNFECRVIRLGSHTGRCIRFPDFPQNHIQFVGQMWNWANLLKIHPALERGAHGVDALVNAVRRGDHVKPFSGQDDAPLTLEFRNDHRPVGQHRQQRILQCLRATSDFLEPDEPAFHHAPKQRAGHQSLSAWPFLFEYGFVPAVQKLPYLADGATLQGQRGRTGDRCCQEFREPGFCGSRFPDQQTATCGT